MTAREDILEDLQAGPRLATWLAQRHSRPGLDVDKVLAGMLADGQIRQRETVYCSGRFVAVYEVVKDDREGMEQAPAVQGDAGRPARPPGCPGQDRGGIGTDS